MFSELLNDYMCMCACAIKKKKNTNWNNFRETS